MKVTFKLNDNRTHTHKGVVYRDGDTADVSAGEREKLDRVGVISKPSFSKRKRKKDDDE